MKHRRNKKFRTRTEIFWRMTSSGAESLLDDIMVDRRLDNLENELDRIERQELSLVRRLSTSPLLSIRNHRREDVDHASLMSNLIARVEDPKSSPSGSRKLPQASLERFIKSVSDEKLDSTAKMLTEGLCVPRFGGDTTATPSQGPGRDVAASSIKPPRSVRFDELEPLTAHSVHIFRNPVLNVPVVEYQPERLSPSQVERQIELARELESLKRLDAERERDLERSSRQSSENLAKDLFRTLRGLETQLVQEVKMSESERRNFEREITRMREAIENLELDRQALLDRVELATAHESTARRSIDLLRSEITSLEKRNLELQSELGSNRREKDILRSTVQELEHERTRLQSEVKKLRESHPKHTRYDVGINARPGSIQAVTPDLPSPKLLVQENSPSVIEPHRMSTSSISSIPRHLRSSFGGAPFATHEGIDPVGVPKATEPHRMSVSDLVEAQIRQRSASFPKSIISDNPIISDKKSISIPVQSTVDPSPIVEDEVQCPPTPTTPKPRQSLSPKPKIDEDAVERELLALNVERAELEGWLGRFPPNSAGRTLAERKEKYLKEQRLRDVVEGISHRKSVLRIARERRKNPTGEINN